ncbi:Uncharacterized protein OS=Lysinibacillus fusiformis ZB2 GN=C518_2415 PE=4 SV=1 [Gemmataceae bacterium]|nr:Uncharacterized protein OS=Lysinibacillus fusiformis ZB2 GN=C518_2415 PE=4 SV=1 [Gemmataceae bacterium]VTT98817.1 Uncharacterized protein OS=Lysinibacillus fusiformis ZB2 GN=C518_2415 PE=4 SV=1 [Gemmataceae bacterium]
MRLSNRSFPHPVVGNGDDVPGAEFQVTFEFEADKSNFYLKALVQCSSQTLLKAIRKGRACYTMHVECSNTLFRHTYDFDTETHRVTIPTTAIHDTVEVNAFVRAKAAIPKYTVEGAHPDYGDAVFQVGPGDILAVADGQTFDADHSVDPLRRVGALMVVEQSGKPVAHPMEADFDADKIRILLCEEDFAAYGDMKAVPHLTNHLTTTLVLPVLIEAIHLLGDEPDAAPENKWAKILSRRLETLAVGSSATALEKAQQLLGLPIRRALASAQTYLAGSSS